MIDLQKIYQTLGLESVIIDSNQIHEKHGNALYRIKTEDTSYILKIFQKPMDIEIQSYLLLNKYQVPTLKLHGYTDQAILLENLDISPNWRLANGEDLKSPEVGRAIARWYQKFHGVGEEILRTEGVFPSFLSHEEDFLNPDVIYEIGQKYELSENPIWGFVADRIHLLQEKVVACPQVLNYNDFYWTNLARTRNQDPVEAKMFDFHLLGIGTRYSDCRNITSSLDQKAAEAFWEVYGAIDEREKILDKPLSLLIGLGLISAKKPYPIWIQELLDQVVQGEFERDLRVALEI